MVLALSALATSPTPAGAQSSSPLFSTYDVLPLKLEAPFNDLFARARTNDEYGVTGKLSYTHDGREVVVEGVKLTLRGNTSRREAECAFPKLKVQLPANAAAGPLGAGGTSLKLGTHCGEAADDKLTVKYGRLPNERSPLREAFVYRLLESIGVPTLKARPARVSYVYTDARTGQTPAQDQPIVRNALRARGYRRCREAVWRRTRGWREGVQRRAVGLPGGRYRAPRLCRSDDRQLRLVPADEAGRHLPLQRRTSALERRVGGRRPTARRRRSSTTSTCRA